MLALAFGLILVALAAPARAQFCPGVTPWVFDDVQASDPFCGFVTFMATSGVTTGCATIDANHRLYCPEGFVTRKQMAAFMGRLASNAVFAEGGNAFGVPANLGTTDTHPLHLLVDGAPAIRLLPHAIAPNVIAGHASNSVDPPDEGQTIAGGGGPGNDCPSPFTVPATRPCANRTNSPHATVGGGRANSAEFYYATVSGGASNIARGQGSTVAGGLRNVASGYAAFAAGGEYNYADQSFTFAAGRRARATTIGSFIWADSQNFDFQPSVPNFFGVRATGGVGFTVAIDGSTGGVTQFCNYLPGYSGWSCTSDRDAKENLEPVRGSEVLDRLVAMPVYTYNFRGSDPALRMLGTTAQDFHDAFGLGEERTSIASGNLHGVALAAIQGLNAKVDDRESALRRDLDARDAEIASLRTRVSALAQAVEALQRLVASTGAAP
jgi:hypothetical protein